MNKNKHLADNVEFFRNMIETDYKQALKRADEHFNKVYELYNSKDTDTLIKQYQKAENHPCNSDTPFNVIKEILNERGICPCYECGELCDKSEMVRTESYKLICKHCLRGFESRT